MNKIRKHLILTGLVKPANVDPQEHPNHMPVAKRMSDDRPSTIPRVNALPFRERNLNPRPQRQARHG